MELSPIGVCPGSSAVTAPGRQDSGECTGERTVLVITDPLAAGKPTPGMEWNGLHYAVLNVEWHRW
jgi:hypothetical protein